MAGLNMISVPLRHLGTERCYTLLQRLFGHLCDRIDMRPNRSVSRITVNNNKITGVVTGDGQEIAAKYVIVAPGREGCGWLMQESDRLGLTKYTNPVDIGLRVEVRNRFCRN